MTKYDPIKQFVEKNKQAFDEQFPTPDVLPAIKAALGQQPRKEELKLRKSAFMLRIVAAAMFVLALGITWIYLLPDRDKTERVVSAIDKEATLIKETEPLKETKPLTVTEQSGSAPETLVAVAENQAAAPKTPSPAGRRLVGSDADAGNEIRAAGADRESIMGLLDDSLSGSARLKGILMLAELSSLDDAHIRILEEKLATDPSLHVRMAAIDLLNRHSPMEEVAERIIDNLSKQEDPIMQLSLMNAAAGLTETQLPIDTFRHCLNELVQNPATLDMVREEAAAFLFAYQEMPVIRNKSN